MNARQQAHEAAVSVTLLSVSSARRAASAASDVWEAILRPLVAVEPVSDLYGCVYCPSGPDSPHKPTCPWLIAKEALDGSA